MTPDDAQPLILRPAEAEDTVAMSELALRSKGHWSYSDEFLDACRDELTYTRADVAADHMHFVVAVSGTTLCGFYGLSQVGPAVAEVEALFVDPTRIGSGLGGQLWRHAVAHAQELGLAQLTIQSDPNAEPFYAAMGAVTRRRKESGSVPGRFLPWMTYDVPVASG